MASATTFTKFAHLQFPLADVLKATNNFHPDNIIGRGGLGPAYKGQLRRAGKLVKISALRLDRKHGGRDVEFWTEISALSDLDHPNIVSIIGFCDEKNEKVIITSYAAKGSLKGHLDSPKLTWTQRLKICVGVARALSYLHYDERRGYGVIHLNVNSSTILLDENLEAKLSGFKVSIKQSLNRMDHVVLSDPIGTIGYVDPAIETTKGVTHKSDIYSFGVVLFEILCGMKAFIRDEANRFLAPLAKSHYENETLQDIILPAILDQMSPQSLRRYSKTAYFCLKEERAHRPHMLHIVDELEKALNFKPGLEDFLGKDQVVGELENAAHEIHEGVEFSYMDEFAYKHKNAMQPQSMHEIIKNKANLRISFEDVKQATQNFHSNNCIGGGGFGKVYKGNLKDGDGFKTIVAKRLDTKLGQGEQQFLSELQILLEYKHENVIGLIGYCDENNEKIIVFEYAPKGSLDRYLSDVSLTWVERLNICIDVANALYFFHGGVGKQARVIHRDIKSANILLNDGWKAKLADFGLSLISPLTHEIDYIIDHACGTVGYLDPLYREKGFLTLESDIYSFGIVLFEMLCGRSTYEIHKQEGHYLPTFIKNNFGEGKHNEVVFKKIKEQIELKSLTTFQKIAYQCLHHKKEERPTIKEVLVQLKKALEFQVRHRLFYKRNSLSALILKVINVSSIF
ncbi:putative protein kinase RLK-Pelle-LRR-I-1 family [Helianthus annuus]|nr:putative protein kinase RLK-Pelle-LRR-I-1 family [Helianthus annuus]